MEQYRIHYDLRDGYVQDWLVLGLCSEAVDTQAGPPEILTSPVQPLTTVVPTQLDKVRCGSGELFWKLEHAGEDHRIERDRLVRRAERVQMWAFCLLESNRAQVVNACLMTDGAAALFLNDQLVLRVGAAGEQEASYILRLSLEAGENKLLLLVEDVTARPIALSMAVQLLDGDLRVGIPILSRDESYWYTAEQAFARSRLDRAVYAGEEMITLLGPEVTEEGLLRVNVRLQKTDGATYGDLERPLLTGEPQPLIPASQLPSGSCQALVMPLLDNYYEKQFRPSRALPFLVANQFYAPSEDAPYEKRLQRLIQEAGRQEGIFGELARLAAEWYRMVDPTDIERVMQAAQGREAGWRLDMLGLLLLQARLSGDPLLAKRAGFKPDFLKSLRQVINGYDSTLKDALGPVELFLDHAIQALAGQNFPAHRFVSGRSGAEEQALGEHQAADWLREQAYWGFTDWNPDSDGLAAALVLLVDLSHNTDLSDLAAVFLDKLLFLLALQSFQGLPEATRKNARASEMKSARFQPGAALGLLLWGEGVYNNHLVGAVSLALSENYSLPDMIRAVAQDHAAPVWARLRSQTPEGGPAILQTMYKTGVYRLSSAQAEGQPSGWAHLWQATLGPEALVFTNAPGRLSQSDARPAGFWRGNRGQPQIFQWKDALSCLYQLPEDSPLGFTHAYFPTEAFDEYRLEGNWAFARRGQAYLSLFASQNLILVTTGDEAYRELRVVGTDTAWLCQLGQASQDDTFEDFCAHVLASAPQIKDGAVRWQTIRDDTLDLGWNETPRVNGAVSVFDAGKHFESPYTEAELPASTFDIHYGDELLHLDFA